MMFRAPFFRTIRWSAWEGCEAGLEHCEIRSQGDRIMAAGVVIGATEDKPFGLGYRLIVDASWRVREAGLRTASGTRLNLASDGHGRWQVNGERMLKLDDCIDIDIEASPLTNTLPIRRLDFERGHGAIIRVVYINVPDLTVEVSSQRYTALDRRLYRFESLDTGFTADLPVDEDGLVLDYPGLFRRLG